jgi:hypothetical protein
LESSFNRITTKADRRDLDYFVSTSLKAGRFYVERDIDCLHALPFPILHKKLLDPTDTRSFGGLNYTLRQPFPSNPLRVIEETRKYAKLVDKK